jgi:hypothetical protein
VDFFQAIGILARRWPVALAGIALTLGAAVAGYNLTAPRYDATGQYFLVVPASPPDDPVTGVNPLSLNPFLQYGNLHIVSEVLARRMNSSTVGEALQTQGAGADYLVDIVAGESPTVLVRTTGDDAGAVLESYGLVAAGLRDTLEALQRDRGAPDSTMIQLDVISEPTQVAFQQGSKIRALAAIGILGLSGTVLAAFLVEGVLLGRRRRNGAPSVEPTVTLRREEPYAARTERDESVR